MSKKLTAIIKNISERELLSAVIWGGIGICNLISFFSSLPVILIFTLGFGLPLLLPTLALGIWGLIMAISHFKKSKKILNPTPETIETYYNSNNNIIISVILLFVCGSQTFSLLAFICALCDTYFIRGYVLENKELFDKEIRTVGVEVETIETE